MFSCRRILHIAAKCATVVLSVAMAVSALPMLPHSYAAQYSVEDCTVGGVPSFFVYTGKAIKPAPELTFDGKKLTENTDYTVTISDNINAGTATIKIDGIGSFSGSMSFGFEIKPHDISDTEITLIKTRATYRGSGIKPAVSVKFGGRQLVENEDYTVGYSDNVNVGTAAVTVSGIGNFCGSESRSFNIIAHSIDNASAELTGESFYYTGEEIKPAVTVSYGKVTLTEGKDYTLSYSDNVSVGTATVKVVGKGNYSGTTVKDFTIEKQDISGAKLTVDTSVPGCPETVTLVGRTLKKGVDYDISTYYTDGKLTVTAAGMGGYSGKVVTIVPLEMDGELRIVLENDSYTYTAAKIMPAITVYFGDILLSEGDYKISCTDNINVGTATVKVSGAGIYRGLSETAEFYITPASLENCTVSCAAQEYTGTALMPIPEIKFGNYTLENKTDFVVTLYENNRNVGKGTITAVGTGNFTGRVTVDFEIYKNDSSAMESKVKAKLDDMMNGLCDRQINSYIHSYKIGNYYNTMLYSPCVCHSFCMDGTEDDCTCLIGRSTVLNNVGIQCAGFTFEVFEYLFGGTNQAGGNKLTIKGRNTSGWSESALKAWAQTFKPGDYLAYTNVSYGYDHYVTVYSVDSDGIWVYEANYGGRCKVNFRKFYFSEMYEQCDDFWHRTPVNYELS